MEVPEDRAEDVEVLVEQPPHRVLAVAEPPDGDRDQHDEHPAHGPLDGQEAQDEQVPQHLAARHQGRLGGRSGSVRLAEHEVAAAQTAPDLAERGVGVQPDPQPGVVRRVGHMPLACTCAPVPVDRHPPRLP